MKSSFLLKIASAMHGRFRYLTLVAILLSFGDCLVDHVTKIGMIVVFIFYDSIFYMEHLHRKAQTDIN